MAASEHDRRLAAFLVPLTDEVQTLLAALQHLCSDLTTGDATSEQRYDVDRRCEEAITRLGMVREQVIPTVSGTTLDARIDDRS